MFFQSAAYAVPEEPLSGLAYDSAYDWFYAVKASAPRSVFLLRWDGTGDHLFEMDESYWNLGDARLLGLDFSSATRSLFILADEVSSDGTTVRTTVWETKLNATMVGFLSFERNVPVAAQGLAVVGSGSTIVLVAGSDLVSYTSSLCLDSYDGLALQQEQFKNLPATATRSGPWIPDASATIQLEQPGGRVSPKAADETDRSFGFPAGLPGGQETTGGGLFSFQRAAEPRADPPVAQASTRLRTSDLANTASALDPFMPKSLLAIHNAARVWHGAANLTWDADLKSVAADAAEQCRTASALGGTMVSIGQGLDFVQAGLKWYGEGRFYSSAGTAETFSQMLWKDTERLGCAMAVCRQGTAIACAYDPPGNVWGAYESNVQAVPGSASGMGRSVSDEELPPWLQEQARQQRAAEEGAEQPPEAARRGTPFIPAPGGPSSFIAASRKRAGELADPLQAPNLLLSAPTPALNFLTTPYSLPNFTLPEGYAPSGVDIGCLTQSRGRCPTGFFECRGLCYTLVRRATMPPSTYSGEGQGVELRCGVCAKSRVAFVGQDLALLSVVGKIAEVANRPVLVRKRRFLTSPNPLAAEQYQPWYTFTAYSGLGDEDSPTYDRVSRNGEYDGVAQPGALLCVNTLERLRAADAVGEASHFSWGTGCEEPTTDRHRFWPEDNWPLPGW